MSDIGTGRIREIADNPYGDEEKCWLAKRVLELLDELERKEEQRANWFQMAEKLGVDLDTAERRIAELEARTVTLPAQKYCPDEYGGSVLWGETEVWNQAISECAKAIRAAGIGKGE